MTEKGRFIVDPEVVQGVKVLVGDPLSQSVLRTVVRKLSVTEDEVAIKNKQLRDDVSERMNL